MIPLADKTVGQIVKPDGTPASVPATIIGVEAGQIIRAYFFWALTHQLEPELYCGNCLDLRNLPDTRATYNIDAEQIVITCGCQIRFFQGHTLAPLVKHPAVTVASDAGIGQVLLPEEAARLLRQYKKVLNALNLKEALRCNACYSLDQGDGCEAQVLDSSIRIRCRCSNRTYQGLTI